MVYAHMYIYIYIYTLAVVMMHFFPWRKNGKDREGAFQVSGLDTTAHTFQEYTYKKITPCDVCLQVLRGASTLLLLHKISLQNPFICSWLEKCAWRFTMV